MKKRTTAELRKLAYDARNRADFKTAARRYRQAINRYPRKMITGIYADDLANLKRWAEACESAA